MRKTLLLGIPAILLLGIGTGYAQQRTLGATGTSTPTITIGDGRGPIGVDPPVEVVPPPPPLTVGSALAAKGRLQTYFDYQARVAPSSTTLPKAGLSAENDAVEQTTATPSGVVGPAHVGLLLKRAPASKDAVDPGLAEASRLALRARLGRDPTVAEVGAELHAFDTRIAELNQSLAELRPKIAKAVVSTGNFPRQLEATLLDVAPADPQSKTQAAELGFWPLFQIALTGAIGL